MKEYPKPNDQWYPPVPNNELVNCMSFEDIERVVVTREGVYGRRKEGGWIKFCPTTWSYPISHIIHCGD